MQQPNQGEGQRAAAASSRSPPVLPLADWSQLHLAHVEGHAGAGAPQTPIRSSASAIRPGESLEEAMSASSAARQSIAADRARRASLSSGDDEDEDEGVTTSRDRHSRSGRRRSISEDDASMASSGGDVEDEEDEAAAGASSSKDKKQTRTRADRKADLIARGKQHKACTCTEAKIMGYHSCGGSRCSCSVLGRDCLPTCGCRATRPAAQCLNTVAMRAHHDGQAPQPALPPSLPPPPRVMAAAVAAAAATSSGATSSTAIPVPDEDEKDDGNWGLGERRGLAKIISALEEQPPREGLINWAIAHLYSFIDAQCHYLGFDYNVETAVATARQAEDTRRTQDPLPPPVQSVPRAVVLLLECAQKVVDAVAAGKSADDVYTWTCKNAAACLKSQMIMFKASMRPTDDEELDPELRKKVVKQLHKTLQHVVKGHARIKARKAAARRQEE